MTTPPLETVSAEFGLVVVQVTVPVAPVTCNGVDGSVVLAAIDAEVGLVWVSVPAYAAGATTAKKPRAGTRTRLRAPHRKAVRGVAR